MCNLETVFTKFSARNTYNFHQAAWHVELSHLHFGQTSSLIAFYGTYIHTVHTYIYLSLRQVGLRQPKGWWGPARNLILKLQKLTKN